MKNSLTNLVLAFTIIFSFNLEAVAQRSKVNGPAHVQVGVGLGGYSSAVASSQTPYLIGTFQKTILQNFGPGDVSVGGTVNYKNLSYDALGSKWGMNYFSISGRANWHPHFIKVDKLDAYAGLALGFETVRVRARSADYEGLGTSVNDVALSFHLGARYQINDKIGAWAELGAGHGVMNFGVSYNL